MRGWMGRVLFEGMVLVCWLGQAAAAPQEPGKAEETVALDPKTTTRVTLGSTSGTPGTSVVVPIYFTPAEGKEVGLLKLGVNFVSRNVKFVRLDAGIAAD